MTGSENHVPSETVGRATIVASRGVGRRYNMLVAAFVGRGEVVEVVRQVVECEAFG